VTERGRTSLSFLVDKTVFVCGSAIRCRLLLKYSPFYYTQVFGIQLVYGLHPDSVSYGVGLADCGTGSSAICLRLLQCRCKAFLHRQQHC